MRVYLSLEFKPVTPIGEKPDKTAPARQKQENYHAISQFWLISDKLHLLSATILDNAQAKQAEEERWLEIFTPISYLLFAAGAVLTLISKLAGVESIGE